MICRRLLSLTLCPTLTTNFISHRRAGADCDCSRITVEDLRIQRKSKKRLEDYDFFLRICSKYPHTFETMNRYIVVYNYDIGGDNS